MRSRDWEKDVSTEWEPCDSCSSRIECTVKGCLKQVAAPQPAEQPGLTVLPDGSAFATASWPLPKDHWLYAPRGEWDNERDDFAETPRPILNNSHRQAVIAAIRYAVRGATMCGQEMDFDPDALVQNACYALCGPARGGVLPADAQPGSHGVLRTEQTIPFQQASAPGYFGPQSSRVASSTEKQPEPGGLTDARLIEIRKAVRCNDPEKPWGDSLAFARAVIAADRAARKRPEAEVADTMVEADIYADAFHRHGRKPSRANKERRDFCRARLEHLVRRDKA